MAQPTSHILGSSDHYLHKDFYQRLLADPELFDLVVKNSIDGIWYTDYADPEQEWISPNFWRLLGFQPDDKTHHRQQWQACIDAENLKLLNAYTASYVANPELGFDHVFRFRHNNGSTLWLRIQACLLESTDGQRLVRILHDVSEQKRVERKFACLKERFEMAERGAGVGVWERSTGVRKEEFWSNKFYALLGYSASDMEASSDNFDRLLHPNDMTRFYDMVMTQSDNDDAMFDVECRFKTKSGQYKWFRAAGIAILDENGSIARMVGVIHDIDERKIYEDALEQAVVNLKHSNEELERFAYIASHDLQEPLRVMNTYVELLEERFGKVFDDEAKEYLDFVVQACKRMKQLIRDLLEYSRLGKSSLDTKDVNLKDVMERVEQSLISKIGDKQAELKVGELPLVKGNASELERVLQNLVGNAIKYAHPDRSPEVSVSCTDDGRGYWQVCVADNGIGIKERYFDKVFEIFQRLHSTSKYSGTGVGLAICKRIVQRHGGKIWLRSTPDQGSKFYFSLPKGS